MDGALDTLPPGAVVLALIVFALVPVGGVVYWRIFRNAIGTRGKVRTERFKLPELIFSFLLVTLFLVLIALSLGGGEREVRNDDLVQGCIFYLFLVTAILAFLQVRGTNVGDLLGLKALPWTRAIGRGFLLVLCAYPLMGLTAVLFQKVLGVKAEPQEVVTYFQNAARNSDALGMASTMFMASVLAPFAEEFIFRGFLYGVAKRFAGIVPGILFTSALFAVVHVNLSALPALFVLAVCLNLAYESSGTLVVPVAMHALFNLSQLLFLYILAQSTAA